MDWKASYVGMGQNSSPERDQRVQYMFGMNHPMLGVLILLILQHGGFHLNGGT